MTGSLQIKNGTDYVVLNLKIGGQRKQKWVNTGLPENCSKKDREKKLRQILTQYEDDPEKYTSTVLFCDYILFWLEEAQTKVRTISYEHYANEVKNHIYPYFKALGVRLVDVDRNTCQSYFNAKAKNGRLDGKGGLSPKTLRHHKNILHQTLELAVLNGQIPKNCCTNLSLPKLERKTYAFYNYEETQTFLQAVQNEPLYPLYLFTAVYGLRRSEVLGLKWDSIDLDNKTLTIKHTRKRCNTVVEEDTTKTAFSYRQLPLTEEMVNQLVRLKLEERQNAKDFGSAYQKNGYIFKWPDGKPYAPDYITSKFSKTLKKYGLKHIAFHGLRHSCGSMLNEMGFTLKDIQEWLGHADIQTTANIYLHLDMEHKRNISTALSSALAEKC